MNVNSHFTKPLTKSTSKLKWLKDTMSFKAAFVIIKGKNIL